MPEKKHTVAAKPSNTAKRMTKPQASKTTKTPETAAKAGASNAAPAPGPKQRAAFDAAMKHFHARQFQQARQFFEQAAGGPERDVAQRAQLHIQMCDRRLQQATVQLGSAEDYYNYGVALLNARKVPEARTHLEKALEIAPDSDHIHYALALALALSGEINPAADNLRRAIELEPRNRVIARQDADFAAVVNQPPFQALLFPEKKTW